MSFGERTENSGDMDSKFGFKNSDDLDELLCRGMCTMAYQPIFELASGEVYGFEALLRGSNGIEVPCPDAFFNHKGYVDNDVLLKLDISCIGSALRTGTRLAKEHRLFINIHASTLNYLSRNLKAFLGLLDELAIDTHSIVLEISERTDLVFASDIEKNLRALVKLGIEVAIDDIGASFNWLHHMLNTRPIYLKVDKAYICDINVSTRKQALVRSLHLMCHAMGLKLIAEGIENSEQLRMLNAIGISFAQGFWFGRPGPAEEWIRR